MRILAILTRPANANTAEIANGKMSGNENIWKMEKKMWLSILQNRIEVQK